MLPQPTRICNRAIYKMAGYSFPQDQKNHWTLAVEASLERGQSPLLDLGAAGDLLENLPALVTLHAYADERRDPTEPVVLVGGNPLFWLAATLAEPAAHGAPSLQITYSGADLATHIAAVQLEAAAGPRYELPTGFVSLLAPGAQTGASRWEALPLAWAQAAGGPILAHAATPDILPSGDRWLTWAGLAVTLLLVAGSLTF